MLETKQITVNCETHGLRTLTHHKLDGQWFGGETCDLCREEKIAADKLAKAEKQKTMAFASQMASTAAAIGRAGIPQKYAEKGFDHYVCKNQTQQRIFDVCKNYAEQFPANEKLGKSLILLGGIGTGKTHLACAIANYAILQHKRTALFVKAWQVMLTIKSTYSHASQITTEQAMRKFIEPALLIIDEVGIQAGSEAERHLMAQLIDARYDENKPTIITANLPIDDLAAFITPQGIDRLLEGGGQLLTFTWGSARPTLTHAVAH